MSFKLVKVITLILPILLALMILDPVLSSDSSAHQSGCHRWHSCPSDSGSYGCGDLGYDCRYSNTPSNSSSGTSGIPNPLSNTIKISNATREAMEEAINLINAATNVTESAMNDDKNTAPETTSSEAIELSGPVTYVVDGDTLDVNGITIRLALVDTPEIGETGYESAKNFVKDLCLGNDAEVDIDDGQRGGDRYGREIGVVYCNGVNVNSELIEKQFARIYTDYCNVSEFANDDWAECSSTNTQFNTGPATERSTADIQVDNSNCDSSYPSACIASPPPDLDCADVSQKRFTVSGSDPHGFDRDGDGIGCES